MGGGAPDPEGSEASLPLPILGVSGGLLPPTPSPGEGSLVRTGSKLLV